MCARACENSSTGPKNPIGTKLAMSQPPSGAADSPIKVGLTPKLSSFLTDKNEGSHLGPHRVRRRLRKQMSTRSILAPATARSEILTVRQPEIKKILRRYSAIVKT